MYGEIFDFLKMNDVEYKIGASLKAISPIKIGPKEAFLVYPDSQGKLILLVKFLKNAEIKYKILGRMSNVLFCDENYNGIVIRTDRMSRYSIIGNCVTALCGVSLPLLAKAVCKAGLSGLEGLSGIPGSMGGAVIGNAGAFGSEIGDVVSSVDCYDFDRGEIINLPAEYLLFSYRNSIFKEKNWIILSVNLKLTESDRSAVESEMERCCNIRRKTQPTTSPSLGSTFKRPGEGLYAARLIDECGLKGHSVGGAMISEKHAGFIINSGDATARDYIGLSDFVAKCVYMKYGILLEREIELI